MPNLVNAWPEIAERLAVYDPGNQYAVNYMWGTTGIGYNVKAVREISGRTATIDSWDDVFDPDKIGKVQGLRHSSARIHPTTSCRRRCNYLHLDPNASDPADLEKATRSAASRSGLTCANSIRSEYLNALATGEICFAVGFSGDVKQAQKRAAEAKDGVEIGYAIPKEGAQLWFDNLAIPKDAPHVAGGACVDQLSAEAGSRGEEHQRYPGDADAIYLLEAG